MDIEVLRRAELKKLLGTTAALRRAVYAGDWRQVCHDAYVRRGTPDSTRTRLAALRSVLPADIAVSHRTSLWLYGVDVASPRLHVTAPRGRHLAYRAGLQPHSALLPDDELTMLGGLLVVTPARAIVDVARSEALVEAVAVGDAALRLGLASMDGVAASVAACAGLRHVERARAVLGHLEPRSESPMESRYRMVLVLGGLPRPHAQFDVYDDGGHVARTDFVLEGVVLEYDGREQRLKKANFVHDRSRQNRIADLSLEVRRFTSYDVYQRPGAAVCADVVRAIRIARGRDLGQLRSGPDTLPKPRRRPPSTLADRRPAA
jgi:hypothetical protein